MATYPIRFGIQTGQQDVSWERMRDFWQKVDRWGYDSLWAFGQALPSSCPTRPVPAWRAGRCSVRSVSTPSARASVRWSMATPIVIHA